jgi:hypothetical protein
MAKSTKKETITFNGREIPLTKKGLPSLVHLSNPEKAVVKQYALVKENAKQEILLKDLSELLNKLKI